MKVIDLSPDDTERIADYSSVGAHSRKLAEGHGGSHVFVLRFEPDSIIGEHEAGYAQMFFVVSGSGWVAGADGKRIAIATGQVAVFERGDMHSKGSVDGMTVVMVQTRNLAMASSVA
jgi:quercetin dioxygenase-like cupin family protein